MPSDSYNMRNLKVITSLYLWILNIAFFFHNAESSVILRLENSIYKWEFQCLILKYKDLCCCFSLCISLFFLSGHGSIVYHMGIAGVSVQFIMAWDDLRKYLCVLVLFEA